ncbi:hypothetical protein B0H14DRAFT_2588144 [Mycena olivaceomarginata]|nr:hypothetical protein B0H14DRAFT_2588144 [Mycena olivaceomarginata]
MRVNDHLLTLGSEIKHIWTPRFRRSSAWFLTFRYVTLLGNLTMVAFFLGDLDAKEFVIGCTLIYKHDFLSLICLLPGSSKGTLSLRVCAMYGFNRRVFISLSIAAITTVGLGAAWRWHGKHSLTLRRAYTYNHGLSLRSPSLLRTMFRDGKSLAFSRASSDGKTSGAYISGLYTDLSKSRSQIVEQDDMFGQSGKHCHDIHVFSVRRCDYIWQPGLVFLLPLSIEMESIRFRDADSLRSSSRNRIGSIMISTLEGSKPYSLFFASCRLSISLEIIVAEILSHIDEYWVVRSKYPTYEQANQAILPECAKRRGGQKYQHLRSGNGSCKKDIVYRRGTWYKPGEVSTVFFHTSCPMTNYALHFRAPEELRTVKPNPNWDRVAIETGLVN